MISGRFVDTDLDRPRWRFTLNYRVIERLQVGIEYNPAAREIGPLASFFVLTETERAPALFLGTSSDRIGSPAGKQSYYITAAKYLQLFRTSLYASVNYSEWDAGINFPFGGNLELGKGVSTRVMYDGNRTHLMLNYFPAHFGVSLMYVWLESAGVSLFIGF